MPITEFIAVGVAFIAAFASGLFGFGGALLLLVALNLLLGVERALPLLALAQLVGNAARVFFHYRALEWRSLFFFCCGALPAGLIAAGALTQAKPRTAQFLVAILIVIVALLELATAFRKAPVAPAPARKGAWLFGGGLFIGILSGLAGTTGPLPNAIFLRLGFSAATYLATEAAAMGLLHLAKLVAFGAGNWLWRLDWRLALMVCAAMPAGTWCAKYLVHRIPPKNYRRSVAIWMAVVAVANLAVTIVSN
ncbi:MAG: sulfite exporter TauE/SafE family protein [Turneriella sp.]|nr:sulfite exporter TauE/SafE family protein [Turneriella sp.]